MPFLLPTLFSLSSDNSKQAPFNSRKAFCSGRNKKEAIREDLDEFILKYLLYERLLENVFRLEFDIYIWFSEEQYRNILWKKSTEYFMEFFRSTFKLALSTVLYWILKLVQQIRSWTVILVGPFQLGILFYDSRISEFSFFLLYVILVFCSSVTAQPILAIKWEML